jgi:rhodanese-related sulfurtransferase
MKQLTPPELMDWIAAGKDFLLVDVREEWERALYHIGGEHIPMGLLFSRLDTLPRDKDIVLYCEKGVRSVVAIQRMEAYGFHNLYNLAGGMKNWKASL